MVDEGRAGGTFGTSGTKLWEDSGNKAVGTILATALAAGVVAFLLRRSQQEDETPTGRISSLARSFADSDNIEVGRDFFMARILPEFKPALLSILGELEEVVDQAFRRSEKAIKKL